MVLTKDMNTINETSSSPNKTVGNISSSNNVKIGNAHNDENNNNKTNLLSKGISKITGFNLVKF